MLGDTELTKERKAQRLGRPVIDPIFSADRQRSRWSYFKNLTDAEAMLRIVQDEALPFIKNLGGEVESAYACHIKGAIFLIVSSALLASMRQAGLLLNVLKSDLTLRSAAETTLVNASFFFVQMQP